MDDLVDGLVKLMNSDYDFPVNLGEKFIQRKKERQEIIVHHVSFLSTIFPDFKNNQPSLLLFDKIQ